MLKLWLSVYYCILIVGTLRIAMVIIFGMFHKHGALGRLCVAFRGQGSSKEFNDYSRLPLLVDRDGFRVICASL